MGKRSRRTPPGGTLRPASPPPPAGAPAAVDPRMQRRILLGLLGLGLLLRILYLLQYRAESVYFDRLMLDAQVYDQWARRIVAGEWLGGPVFYHAPLYPYLLAVLYRLFGTGVLPVYLFQIGLGILTLYLVYRAGARMASPVAGLGAAGLLVFYAPLPFFETKVMSTTLAVCLSAGALVLLARAWDEGGALRWLVAGLVVGAAALAHPASLLLAPVFGAALLLRLRRKGIPAVVALAAGTALAVAPATAHNLAAGGGWVLISAQGGITFYQGNLPAARGLYRPVPGFSGSPLTQMAEEQSIAEKAVGHPLRAAEVSGYWFDQGWQSIRSRPGEWIGLLQMKLARWLSSHEYSTEYSLRVEQERIGSLWIPFLPFGFLVAGAAAGVLLGMRGFPRLLPALWYLLATLLPTLIFYVSSRYRIAAVPALAILSGVALERLLARARAGEGFAAAGGAAAILLAGCFTLIPFGRDHLYQEANVHYNTGNLFYDRGEFEVAVAEYQRALAVSEMEYYRVNLGNALTRLRRYDEAGEQYRLALAHRPRFAKAQLQWAKALLEQGRREEAAGHYRAAVELGLTSPEFEARLAGAGEAGGDTMAAARQAVAANPRDASAHNTLGIALLRAGRTDEAEQEYRRAMALDPRYEKARYNLGVLLESRSRYDEALAEFEAAVRINPAYSRAHLRAAGLLARRGDYPGARRHYEAVLAAEPGQAEATAGLRNLPGPS